jgi:hypothetical protein
MDTFLSIVLAAAIIAGLYYLGASQRAANDELVRQWATANGLRILHQARALTVWSMPFTWIFTTGRYQPVFHLSVYDESTHRVRKCWMRLGKSQMGILADDDNNGGIDVKWEDDK